MGSAKTADFPKDTELELDNVGTIALDGGTSSGGVIERAVDVLQGDPSDLRSQRLSSRKHKLSTCKSWI